MNTGQYGTPYDPGDRPEREKAPTFTAADWCLFIIAGAVVVTACIVQVLVREAK
jgi:hypothetical protein